MTVVLAATRLAAFKARLTGKMERDDYRKFVRLCRTNPAHEDGERFEDLLTYAVATEATAAGVLTIDGRFIGFGSFVDLLTWIVEHWEQIAPIILFIIGLF